MAEGRKEGKKGERIREGGTREEMVEKKGYRKQRIWNKQGRKEGRTEGRKKGREKQDRRWI